MHATATLSDTVSTGQTSERRTGQSWTGLLVDLSCEGAQIILPCGCEKYLKERQNVAMRIKTTLNNTDVKLIAQVKGIVLSEGHDAVRVGVQFTELESNPDAKDVISRIYGYGEKLKAVNAT
jgi:c-di-GMP-binding flagellar brake protein YcgR